MDQNLTTGASAMPPRSTRAATAKFSQYRAFVFISLGALASYIMYPFMKPMVMGAVFAVVLSPVQTFLRKKIKSVSLTATLVTLFFLFIFVIPMGVLLFLGTQKALLWMHNSATTMPDSFSTESLLRWIHMPELVEKLNNYIPVQYDDITVMLGRGLGSVGTVVSNYLQSILTGLPDALVSGFIMLMAVYYCLADGTRLVNFIRDNSAFDALSTEQLIKTTRLTCQSVINASLVVGLIQSVLMTIACLAARSNNVVLIALVTFLASFLPVVGTAPVTIGLAGYYFAQGSMSATIIMGIAFVIISLSDNIVRPWIIGGGAKMHPLLAFVAAFGGIAMLGFFGLFLGPIVVSIFLRMIPIVTQSSGRPAT